MKFWLAADRAGGNGGIAPEDTWEMLIWAKSHVDLEVRLHGEMPKTPKSHVV